MSHSILSGFYNSELPQIIENLDEKYYKTIEELCESIETNTQQFLQSEEEHPSTALYISLCMKLIEKIRHHMRMRKLVTKPYVYQLYEKMTTNHDCTACADGCQIGHGMKLNGIKEAHQHIKEIFYRMQMVAAPLYAEDNSAKTYRDLRNEIVLIDTKLTELFYLEEAILLPKMIEAQRRIHVRN